MCMARRNWGGAAAIVSTFRLADGISPVGQRALYLERIAKEAAHELGHTFDLRHCKDHQCLMHYCRRIGDVDEKTEPAFAGIARCC